MGFLRDVLDIVVVGRPNGLRARVRRWMRGAPEATRPAPSSPPPVRVTPPSPAPTGFTAAIAEADLPPGELIEAVVDGVPVALCNVDGTFYAVSDVCPHAGGPVGDGTLEGHTVICPYHGWSFDVRDGRCFVNADAPLKTFPVSVVDGQVCVRVAG